VSENTADAREVALLVAKGDLPSLVAQKTDLPLAYVEELTHTQAFRTTLGEVGGQEALDQWEEYQLERESHATLRTKVRARVTDYFEELDAIAMDHKVKPEIRKDIMFRLMDQAKIAQDMGEAVQTIELPPTFFTALAHANEEMDRWNRKLQE